MKYIIIDSANLFFRCKHVAAKGTDAWTKVGFALHLTLTSAAKEFREHNGDHVVFALEGGKTWRKNLYPPYKRNRVEALKELTEEQVEEDKLFFEAYGDMLTFLKKRSNSTVLEAVGCEGDDFIARWIQTHPDDEHVIVSSDTDFVQLLADNVTQYNGVSKQLITKAGYFNDKGEPVKDKTGNVKAAPDPQFELFMKCVRGDKSDNIFSAFPGAREKGTKNKIGIREAFNDRISQGYNWNNFMLQRWVDHKEVEHKVLEDFNRNVTLVDLTAQPQDIIDKMDLAIATAHSEEPKKQVGSYLMKFCAKYELENIAKYPDGYADFLNARLPDFED